MRIKKLYIKILVFFIGVMFITEVLILGLFIATAGRAFKHHFKERTISKIGVFKTMVQEKIDRNPAVPVSQRKDVKEFLGYFAGLFDISIWLINDDDAILMKTENAPAGLPQDITYDKRVTLDDNIQVYYKSRRHFSFYARFPVHVSMGEEGTVHIQYNEKADRKPEGFFLVGLLIIGGVIAVLLVPLSRAVTRRVNHLNASALNLAGGDLSCRAGIKGHDEIARLGQSFDFMADKLEQMIRREKEMTANISHELRSPLARISLSKEIIKEKLDKTVPDSIGDYLDAIDEDVMALDRLIQDILHFSKTDLYYSEMTFEPVDLSALTERVIQKFTPVIGQKKIRFSRNIEKNGVVNGHRESLLSVWSNIFDNALKYTPRGGRIKLKGFLNSSGQYVVQVINSPAHIAPGDVSRIFNPFFRGENTGGQGSGLGLYIARKIIKQHQGSLRVRQVDQGVLFEVLLDRI